MAESQTTPNGPAPYAARPDGAHLPSDPAPSSPAGTTGSPPRFAPNRPDATGRPDARPGTEPTRSAEVKGRIHIADEVVEKVAGLAALEVEGVADVGGDFERAIESVRERIGLGNKRGDQGIKAEVKGHEVAISVTIMVEFGHVVLDVARQVQSNVAHTTQRMLGLKVVEVNVTVDDVRTTRAEPQVDEQAELG